MCTGTAGKKGSALQWQGAAPACARSLQLVWRRTSNQLVKLHPSCSHSSRSSCSWKGLVWMWLHRGCDQSRCGPAGRSSGRQRQALKRRRGGGDEHLLPRQPLVTLPSQHTCAAASSQGRSLAGCRHIHSPVSHSGCPCSFDAAHSTTEPSGSCRGSGSGKLKFCKPGDTDALFVICHGAVNTPPAHLDGARSAQRPTAAGLCKAGNKAEARNNSHSIRLRGPQPCLPPSPACLASLPSTSAYLVVEQAAKITEGEVKGDPRELGSGAVGGQRSVTQVGHIPRPSRCACPLARAWLLAAALQAGDVDS